MKAAVCERYGPPEVVVIKDVPEPAVGDHDVLVRVSTTALTVADARIRGLRVPRAVGVMAVQIAKQRGAQVTGVCSAGNVELVRSLGADHVIDYAARDFTRETARYDLVMDNVGNAPYARVRHLLTPGGRFLMVIGDLPQMLAGALRKAVVTSGKEDEGFHAGYYRQLLDLAATGRIRAVIDRSFALDEIVQAHRLVDTGRKRGSVVITVAAGQRLSCNSSIV